MTIEHDDDPELDALLARAEHGDGGAMAEIGDICLSEQLVREAQDWFRKAGEAGSARGFEGLARIALQFGRQDDAIAWYLRAIDAGDEDSLYPAAVLMLTNPGEYGDRGLELLERGHAAGRAECAAQLGAVWLTRQDRDQAELWFRRAAAGKDPGAARVLAQLLEADGRREDARAMHEYAADLGELESLFRAAELTQWRTDDPNELYELAEAGDVGAMIGVGRQFIDQGNLPAAVEWLSGAVDAGSVPAMTVLGNAFAGAGNDAEAGHWYAMAAEQGDRLGAYHLGELLIEQGRYGEARSLLAPLDRAEALLLLSDLAEVEADAEANDAALERLKQLVAATAVPALLAD